MAYTGNKPTNVVDVSETQALTVDGDLTISDKIVHSDDANTAIRFPAADTVTIETAGSERVRIDSSGKVGIGNSAPDTNLEISDTSGGVLRLSGTTGGGSGATEYDIGSVEFKSDDDSSGGQRVVATVKCEADTGSTVPGGELLFLTRPAGTSDLTERMRIDSNGNILLACTTTGTTSGGAYFDPESSDRTVLFTGSSSTSSGINLIAFNNPNGIVGTISTASSSTSYNTSSDYRLKENVTDITGAIDRVKTLAPKRFNFKVDPDNTVDGFLAHEVTTVPEAVTGTKDETEAIGDITDADNKTVETGVIEPDTLEDGCTWTKTGVRPVYQGIDQSKLVPLLTAALQEVIAKNEALELRVAALEAD